MAKTAANAANTSMSGTTELKSPPNTSRLLNPELAQPCGVRRAIDCIHFGVIKSGHQQPPSGARTSETRMANAPAPFSVLAKVASMIENEADTNTMATDSTMTPKGDRPISMPNTRTPAVQKMITWISHLTTVPKNIPPSMAERRAEPASSRSKVLLCRSRTIIDADCAAAKKVNITR
jgi:hypothetical protein